MDSESGDEGDDELACVCDQMRVIGGDDQQVDEKKQEVDFRETR